MEIRRSTDTDIPEILNVHAAAFGQDKGPVIADLVNSLFSDKTAKPLLSLVAIENNRLIGHILYTKVIVTPIIESVSARILAPLAVLPEAQNGGVGSKLIQAGLEQLKKAGVQLVFVLGHPGYYPRCGFSPAGALGFEAPYPIPEEHAAAWMVQQLVDGVIGNISGKVQCADVLNRPEHWRE